MNLHRHALAGCTPTPLAHYLKALATLRLVHLQADPAARARWTPGGLELATALDEGELLGFFLDRWSPTPFLDPWNGGSGFYPKDKAALADGLAPLRATTHPRFAPYRAMLDREWARTRGWTERPSDEGKYVLQTRCRNEWTEEALSFLRAAFTPVGEEVKYPAVLGTGGNDGKLNFSANFMKRLWDVFTADGTPAPSAAGSLRAALFGDATPSLVAAAVGQFFPGGAGGANGTDGFSAEASVNPWDFLLMLEGTVALPVATSRSTNAELPLAAAPFTFQSVAAGFGTACRGEESARGEQWFPTWDRWASWPEVEAVFREGRMGVPEGSSSRPSRRALDAARAVRQHGAARGIRAFHRYAYIERNGQANLAVPVGRMTTDDDPHVALLSDVADWVRAFRSAVKEDGPPSLVRLLSRLEGAMWAVCQSGTPDRWQALVIALGEAEAALVTRPRLAPENHLRPLPRLRAGWWDQLGDSPEVGLAAAITGAHHHGRPALRPHVVPLDGGRFAQSEDRLHRGPDVVWTGRALVDDLVAVLKRRALAAEDGVFPMCPGTSLSEAHLAAFLDGRVDDRRLSGLIRGMTTAEPREGRRGERADLPGPYVVVRLAVWPGPVEGLAPNVDRRPLELLAAGRYTAAVEVAAARLGARGLRVKVRSGVGTPSDARRLAAALAFPPSLAAYDALERTVRRTPERPTGDPS